MPQTCCSTPDNGGMLVLAAPSKNPLPAVNPQDFVQSAPQAVKEAPKAASEAVKQAAPSAPSLPSAPALPGGSLLLEQY